MGPLKNPPFSGQSSDQNFEKFFIIKRISEHSENFGNVSPFLVEKAITGSVGIVTSTKLMRSGDLLVEVASRQQALQIKKLQSLSTLSVSVKSHETLNTSKGVITCGRLLNLPIEEITRELSGQGVKDVRRINIRRDGELVPTKHFILTFNTPRLPEYIKAGYVRCSVRPYIPNPLRCFKCQRFGHSKTNCRGTLTCARCAAAGHESTGCKANEKCVNCQGEHTSFSRSCPKWKVEKEVVAIKFKNNITFLEARRIARAQSAPEGGSYAFTWKKATPPTRPHIVLTVTICSETSAGTASQNASEFTIVKLKKKSKISSKNQSANNNQITTNTVSKFWKTLPNNAHSSSSGNAHHKNKNKTDKNKTSSAKTVHSTSDASDGNSSDTDSDLTVTSAPEVSSAHKSKARSKSEQSQKLKQAKRGLSQKDLPAKLKKSAHQNSVSLGLADRGIVHKDLPSIFVGVPQVPDLKLHPSDEDEDLQMNCDASETSPCVPTSNPPTLS
ncbi:hypothetical protein AVEN_187734-1 [Araneus ventricosus]|uniref:CCHC-type domain-containing protein n=1 Tax=Araneus ventricosus TaxID=182803 RepID=A0A4Y2C444_ARAVE|nr:hypothetical protein AVEN_187734-1 [Araneus ventricosus]